MGNARSCIISVAIPEDNFPIATFDVSSSTTKEKIVLFEEINKTTTHALQGVTRNERKNEGWRTQTHTAKTKNGRPALGVLCFRLSPPCHF